MLHIICYIQYVSILNIASQINETSKFKHFIRIQEFDQPGRGRLGRVLKNVEKKLTKKIKT